MNYSWIFAFFSIALSLHRNTPSILIFKLLELFAARLQSDCAKIPFPFQTIYAQLQMPSVFPSCSIVPLRISIVACKIRRRRRMSYWWQKAHFYCLTCSIVFSLNSKLWTNSKSFCRSASDDSRMRSSNFCCSDN